MALDWFEIGSRWLERHSATANGDRIRETAAFAKSETLEPNTLRGFKAGAEFVLKLRRQGLIDDGGVQILSTRKLKSIAVLQRVSKYGAEALAPLLDAVLTPRCPSRAELERWETLVRKRLSQNAPDTAGNAHRHRIGVGDFRRTALAAWDTLMQADGRRVVLPSGVRSAPPFRIDAIAVGHGQFLGLRLVANAAASAAVRDRFEEAVCHALAAARVFQEILLVAQSTADAARLGALVRAVGDCGVGVSSLGKRNELEAVVVPNRGTPPDLSNLYVRLLTAIADRADGKTDPT